MDALTSTITELASALTPEAADRVAAAVIAAGAPGFGVRAALQRALPTGKTRELALTIAEQWEADPATHTGAGIAMALVAATRASETVRASHQAELVWTGPPSAQFEARRTDIALHEVVRGARDNLILMSYASYTLPILTEALTNRLQQGLTLWFLLETTTDSDGKFKTDGKTFFEQLSDHGDVRFFRWPLAQRPTRGHMVAAMHAKAAIADDHTMLITSANLTDAAMTMNMELGLLITGGPLPVRVRAHFHDMIKREVITPHL